MRILGMVDGEIVNIDAQVISIEDRGHQFGDGAYEVTRVYGGRPFALKEHLVRMERSLRELRIPQPFTMREMEEFHVRLIKEAGVEDAAVYMQVTRGMAPRIHHFPENIKPRLTMTIRPVRALAGQLREQGAKVVMVPDERWLRCDIKSLNLLGNILAKQAAQEQDCFEAIMVRGDIITEGSSSNVFVVKDGVIYTHPLTKLILPGITRRIVLDEASKAGVVVKEECFTPEFLLAADEVFLSGTSTEVMPIVKVNETVIEGGTVGPVTKLLQKKYNACITAACGKK